MTSKVGTIDEFMRWTKRVVVDPQAAGDTPKRWFDSAATAAKAGRRSGSPQGLVKLLSDENLALLQIIGAENPHSMQALAERVGRKPSNLSRTLKKLADAGIVSLDPGPKHTVAPRLVARRVTLDLDLIDNTSSVAIAVLSGT